MKQLRLLSWKCLFLSSLNQVSYSSRASTCTSFILNLPYTVHLLLLLLFSLPNTFSKWHLSSSVPCYSSLSTSSIHQIGLILIPDTSNPDELCVTKHGIHFWTCLQSSCGVWWWPIPSSLDCIPHMANNQSVTLLTASSPSLALHFSTRPSPPHSQWWMLYMPPPCVSSLPVFLPLAVVSIPLSSSTNNSPALRLYFQSVCPLQTQCLL